jgi:hypothetical protein
MYRPQAMHSLAESIPGLLKSLQIYGLRTTEILGQTLSVTSEEVTTESESLNSYVISYMYCTVQ